VWVRPSMSFYLSRWRTRLAAWRKASAWRRNRISSRNARTWIVAVWGRLSKLFIPAILSFIQILLILFFQQFFEPFSSWFWIALLCTIIIFVLIGSKYYLASTLTLLAFAIFIVTLSFSASYQIASDQFRLRYRTTAGASYFEFPEQLHFLKSIAGNRLISIAKCDATKVAVLPLLPYEPLFLENRFIDRLGFRRLPNLQFENVSLNVGASIGHRSVGIELGFSSTDQATIPLTWIFPRSMNCKQNNVPLIPILEVLPWNPDDVGALVEATIRVDQIRTNYPDHSMSLDKLRSIHMNNDGTYGPLLDVFVYSMLYQMFQGNVFAQMRAHVADTLCRVVGSHPSAFSGPFGALPENFSRRLVAQLKSKVRLVAPACNVSEDLVQAYEKSTSTNGPALPFDATFKDCMQSTMSMAQCLAKDDMPKPKPPCEGLACNIPSPPAIPDEMLLEDYDLRVFGALVATKQNRLLSVSSLKPSECPNLRDEQENKYFIDWWIDYSNSIAEKPVECASAAWQAEYNRRRTELDDALSCASKKNIRGARYERTGPYLIDVIYTTKCTRTVNIDENAIIAQFSDFFDQIDDLILRINRYRDIIGDSESQSLIRALHLFATMKQNVCGARRFKACIAESRQSYGLLAGKIVDFLGLSNVGDDQRALIDALTKLDNVMIKMAICDALQDEELSKRTGYDRADYCDSHDLRTYRMFGSLPVGHSMQRGNDERDPGVGYFFDSNGTNKGWGIRKFLDKQPN
jgi:hypothetical protein